MLRSLSASARLGVFPLIVLAALLMLVAGCGDGDASADGTTTATTAPLAASSTATTTTAPQGDAPEQTVATATDDVATTDDAGDAVGIVWFANEDGALVGEARPGAAMSVRAALVELAEGPDDAALVPAFPVGGEVVGTDLDGSVVVVEVNAAFEEGYPSGSAAEIATIAPIVYTATELPGVDAVRLEVAGVPLAPPTAQLDLSADLSRADLPMTLVPPGENP